VGPTTARTLIAEPLELGTLDGERIASLAGLAPFTRQSGQWKGKATIAGGRLAAFGGPALTVQPDEVLKDPALESRPRALSAELRCLVCQNESIDDSEAPLARDIRLLIRERIGQGESNDAVRAYLISRYGDFILLKPPFKPETLLLWLSPVLTARPWCLAIGSSHCCPSPKLRRPATMTSLSACRARPPALSPSCPTSS
jgi:cytochrome c-type biogenesis protein CcmH